MGFPLRNHGIFVGRRNPLHWFGVCNPELHIWNICGSMGRKPRKSFFRSITVMHIQVSDGNNYWAWRLEGYQLQRASMREACWRNSLKRALKVISGIDANVIDPYGHSHLQYIIYIYIWLYIYDYIYIWLYMKWMSFISISVSRSSSCLLGKSYHFLASNSTDDSRSTSPQRHLRQVKRSNTWPREGDESMVESHRSTEKAMENQHCLSYG